MNDLKKFGNIHYEPSSNRFKSIDVDLIKT